MGLKNVPFMSRGVSREFWHSEVLTSRQEHRWRRNQKNGKRFGGGRGIRTPVAVTRQTVFKTASFNHSDIPPMIK